MLDDNQTVDVTPRVKNKKYYEFTIDRQKHLIIVAGNGQNLARLDEQPTKMFCVGQKVQFASGFTPGLTTILYKHATHWYLSGDWINAKTTPPTTNTSPTYYQDATKLDFNETYAWWKEGTYYGDHNSASIISQKVVFSNGQEVQIQATGRFLMHRPRIGTYQLSDQPIWLIHNHGHSPPFHYLMAGCWLCELNVGYMVGIESRFNGFAITTQIINGRSDDETSPPLVLVNALDGAEGYNTEPSLVYDVGTSPHSISDNPSTPCNGLTEMHLTFTDFVRFRPAGSADDIYVTLARIQWTADATTAQSNGEYIYPVTDPGHAHAAPQFSSSGTTCMQLSDSSAWPVWQSVYPR